jgi:ketopantoate reductase
MLFKKIAIAAAVATTLAFVGCAKKEAATDTAASEATSEAVVASEAVTVVASEAASDAIDAASDVTTTTEVVASETTVAK